MSPLPLQGFKGDTSGKKKNPPASAGALGDASLIPGLGKSLGGGHGNLLQSSCLENPMDRGAWWAIVHGVKKEFDITETT